MLQCTEQEYAMKFWMLAMLDKRAVYGMNRYADNFKYILESYSRSLKATPGLMLSDSSLNMNQGECRKLAGDLAKLCTRGEINHVLMQGVSDQSQLFYVLVEALYRTMILVRFYAPDGELTEKILKETYCTSMQKSDIELCSRLSIWTQSVRLFYAIIMLVPQGRDSGIHLPSFIIRYPMCYPHGEESRLSAYADF